MNDTLNKFIGSIKALDCWYVSCGATGSTFQLALGGKIPRTDILQNPDHTDEYRRFEGEANLLVWCVWRLDASDGPLTSWDDTKQGIEQGLAKLVGTRVESIDLLVPVWDLNISFSNGLTLRVFCDHVPGEPSFDGNWELWKEGKAAFVGPGTTFSIEEQPPVKS